MNVVFKNGNIIVLQIILILAVGIILTVLNLYSIINLIIYIFLAIEVIWVLKKTYKTFSETNKNKAIVSFVVLSIAYAAIMIFKPIITVPFIVTTSYLFSMGYLFCNACLIMSRFQTYKSKALTWKYIGVFICTISIIVGFLALFGIAK